MANGPRLERELTESSGAQARDADSSPLRVVVIGNGMVGHRFCEALSEQAADESRSGRALAVTVFGEERRPVYDRVHLSEYFSGKSAEDLTIATADWYAEHGQKLHLSQRIAAIDRVEKCVVTASGLREPYDVLVLATGSAPFVPPIPGADQAGVFVYRTIEDLEAIEAWARTSKRAAVIGGGLLGLEAAKAVHDMKLETHVVEFAPRLMPRQVDEGGGAHLRASIEALGVSVHTGARTEKVLGEGRCKGLRFANEDFEDLEVDMVVVSAGIRPRDELAREAGLAVGERGGIEVDDALATSDENIFAIGECALHRGSIYGLVAPGYQMAEALAKNIAGGEGAPFEGADLSTKLKLMGVDVASFGDNFADDSTERETRTIVFQDAVRGVYQKLILDAGSKKLLGGVLVGDTDAYMALHQIAKQGSDLPESPHELLFPASGASVASDAAELPDEAQVCSCNNVSAGTIRNAIAEEELNTANGVKACTRAGSGCGGCVPQVTQILNAELARAGRVVNASVCEHFAFTRQELFQIVKLGRIESFDALLESHGEGDGCEVCRPTVAAILAATWNDLVFRHATVQDTNDRYLANIQRGGTYSVIPAVPGGEILPEQLIVLGQVAKKYELYCKITGGQRVDLLGARVDQLPEIWEELIAAGFESGHAYGKAMRTVKSCVGSSWCRYGVQDSTAFAIRVEQRYRGLRSPHKLKSAVSGCIRECAEAQNKDFGIIATEKGWNVYLGGNGGSAPRHGELVAKDLPEEGVIKLLDRYLMYYLQTAAPLQRTARWLEEMDGGIEYLKSVILDDALGICEQLEKDMAQLLSSYSDCEWKQVVEDPELRAQFRHFADPNESSPGDEALHFVEERGQKRPVDWPEEAPASPLGEMPSEDSWDWRKLATTDQFPANGGAAVRYGAVQLAIYNFERRGEWFATQAMCPHRKDNVLARGLLGSQDGEAKVACPLHKKTFSLQSGKGLNDPNYQVRTFPVRIEGDDVWVKLPPQEALEQELARLRGGGCGSASRCG